MNREFLKGLGLDEAAVEKVMAEHGKTVESHKSKVTDLESSITDLQSQLTQRDADLKDLKKKAEGSEELQTQLSSLQTKYDTDKADFESKLKDTQLSSALKLALSGKVHDADLVASLIDKAIIELGDDGNVTKGLDEQIKTLQESKSFLFVPEQGTDTKFKGFTPPDGSKGGDKGDKTGSFGEQLAEEVTKSNTGLEEARKSYFE